MTQWGAREAVAGILAAGALFLGFIELAYRPFRLAPIALLVVLIAAAMSREQQKLVAIAVAVITVCSIVGAALAVLTTNPLY
jgi:hypothetical protein